MNLIWPKTGQADSSDAVIMAVVASSAGATNTRYETSNPDVLDSSTTAPSPTPIASRKNIGLTNDVTNVPRHVRLYATNRYPITRVNR